MAKTNFQSGSRVSSAWFNALQNIEFDGEDLDGHYPQLEDESLSNEPGNVRYEFYSLRDGGKVTFVSGLNIRVAACTVALQNGTTANIPQTQLTVANGTRIVYIDNNGSLQVAGSAPETGVMLARVISSGGVVTTISDLRERVNFQIKPISIPTVTAFVMPPGSVIEYAGSVAPSGWLLCDGSEISRATYADLFAAIGTAHGTPSSGTVFKLPDHRNRVGRGVGSGTALGSSGGADNVTLNTNQMPLHSHAISDPGHSHAISDPGHSHAVIDPGHDHPQNFGMGGDSGSGIGYTATNTTSAPDFINTTNTFPDVTGIIIQGSGSNISVVGSGCGLGMAQTGGNTPVDIRNQFIGMNYLIKT
jgi:microcystin-dependent protein